MAGNPLLELQRQGQSVWQDYIRRKQTVSGELKKLIDEDGLRGQTSNPTYFEKAISGSHDYDDALRARAQEGRSVGEIYEAVYWAIRPFEILIYVVVVVAIAFASLLAIFAIQR